MFKNVFRRSERQATTRASRQLPGGGLPAGDFEQKSAELRPMEKLRAEMRDGVKLICLW